MRFQHHVFRARPTDPGPHRRHRALVPPARRGQQALRRAYRDDRPPADPRTGAQPLNLDPGHLPVLAGLWHIDGATARHDAVAWGYAKQAAKRGVEIHQLTEVQDLIIENGAITAVKTNRGTIKCGCAVQAIAGHSSLLMAKAGIRSPIQTFPLQAMVTQPFKPFLDPLVSSSALHCYVQQTSRGEVVFGGGSDPTRCSTRARPWTSRKACWPMPSRCSRSWPTPS
nr:FAD-dependent oxidoreductase [Pseudomonas extremaustralis]